MKRIVIEAHADNGYEYAPEFAIQELDNAFIQQVLRLQKLCVEHDLNECHAAARPYWDGEEDIRVETSEIVVTRNSFWFVLSPKYVNYIVLTSAIPVEFILNTAQPGSEFYCAKKPDEFRMAVSRAVSLAIANGCKRDIG